MVKNTVYDWNGAPVLITGHTGFKGSWLSLWLSLLGAEIYGYALDPPTSPSLFEVAAVADFIKSDIRGDLADSISLRKALEAAQPKIVFHLAAQPLVRAGYADPIGTFETNVMGTAHLLEAIRGLDCVRAVVIITTDKVYENREWVYPYREVDPLGGYDPYSASKAAAEIVVASYRSSFLNPSSGDFPQIATVRAGNVIGGGDWAKDRLVPDCLNAFEQGKPVRLRYPNSVRPWQHVLEPISGYILLAEKLLGSEAVSFGCAWNFGPGANGDATVGEVAQSLADLWGNGADLEVDSHLTHPHEAGLLRLDISRVQSQLGWQPRWTVQEAIQATVSWHQAWLKGENMYDYSIKQLDDYRFRM